MMLATGTKAPDFTLADQRGKAVSLSDFKGKKVVLYFYAEDDTKGCTNQAQRFAELQPEFADKNAVIIGISKDTAESHKAFAEKYHLPFTILADPDKKVINMYGVWGEKKFMGRTYDGIHRISFLIDEQGKIQHVFDKFKTGEHHQVVLDYLQSL